MGLLPNGKVGTLRHGAPPSQEEVQGLQAGWERSCGVVRRQGAGLPGLGVIGRARKKDTE